MTDVIFDDFYNNISIHLKGAKESVKIAVAWINFRIYENLFFELINNKVSIEIIINDDYINAKHNLLIDNLICCGAKIHKIKMPKPKQYMHNKFCIIDEKIVLNGSYNWSVNANNNFENIIISDEMLLVKRFCEEFNKMWRMSDSYIQQIFGCNKYNLIVLSIENNYTTADRYIIDGTVLGYVDTHYYDLNLMQNIYAIQGKYYSMLDDYMVYDDPFELEKINCMIDIDINRYLSNAILSFNGQIHAIGIECNEMKYGDFEEKYIKIIWKERFCMIEDRYEID